MNTLTLLCAMQKLAPNDDRIVFLDKGDQLVVEVYDHTLPASDPYAIAAISRADMERLRDFLTETLGAKP